MMEPWDGPAAIVFTDGRQIGATLDRNGLRPVALHRHRRRPRRSWRRRSACCRSPENKIVKKWRLQPGKMFLIDLEQGRIVDDEELKDQLAIGQAVPAVDRERAHQARGPAETRAGAAAFSRDRLLDRQQAFGYTQEDIKFLMSADGAGRRGRHRLDGQRLAAGRAVGQEQAALQLLQAAVRAGHQPADRSDPRSDRDVAGVVHRPEAQPARHQRGQPADAARGARSRCSTSPTWRSCAHIERTPAASSRATSSTSPTRSPGATKASRPSSPRCAREAVDAIRSGHNILIISDRKRRPRAGRDSGAAGAVGDPPAPGARGPAHDRRPGRRDRLGARGASLRAARRLRRRGGPSVPRAGDARRAARRTCRATSAPTRRSTTTSRRSARACTKVMSKMGISTYMSYCGAQIFEAVGLEQRAGRQVLHRHREPASRASACSRSPKKRSACTAPRSATTRCSRDMLDAGGEYA